MNIFDSNFSAEGRGKIFMHGRSQAVRLPKEFRLPGKEVKITRRGDGILIEPLLPKMSIQEWLAKLEENADGGFMEDGRQRPPMPEPKPIFDE